MNVQLVQMRQEMDGLVAQSEELALCRAEWDAKRLTALYEAKVQRLKNDKLRAKVKDSLELDEQLYNTMAYVEKQMLDGNISRDERVSLICQSTHAHYERKRLAKEFRVILKEQDAAVRKYDELRRQAAAAQNMMDIIDEYNRTLGVRVLELTTALYRRAHQMILSCTPPCPVFTTPQPEERVDFVRM